MESGGTLPGITDSFQTFTLGFRPDLLVITGRFDSVNELFYTWSFVFGGLQDRTVVGGVQKNAPGSPRYAHTLQVEFTSVTKFRFRWTDQGDGDAVINQVRFFAIKV